MLLVIPIAVATGCPFPLYVVEAYALRPWATVFEASRALFRRHVTRNLNQCRFNVSGTEADSLVQSRSIVLESGAHHRLTNGRGLQQGSYHRCLYLISLVGLLPRKSLYVGCPLAWWDTRAARFHNWVRPWWGNIAGSILLHGGTCVLLAENSVHWSLARVTHHVASSKATTFRRFGKLGCVAGDVGVAILSSSL